MPQQRGLAEHPIQPPVERPSPSNIAGNIETFRAAQSTAFGENIVAGTEEISADRINREFLMRRSLGQWEVNVLKSAKVATQIRSSMVLLWILLALNGLLNLGLLTSPDFRHNFQIGPMALVYNIVGFLIVAALSIVTYYRATPGWVTATAISIFPFACGCITCLMAIGLLASLGQIRRSPLELSIPEWKTVKARLKAIYAGRVTDWIAQKRRGKTRLRFFDDAVLILLTSNGEHVLIERSQAGQCSLVPRGSDRYLLTNLPPQAGRVGKIWINEETVNCWRQWIVGKFAPVV